MLNITASELRILCVKHQWFTYGTNTQYDRLFQALESGSSLDRIATMIALCSDETWDVGSIAEIIRECEADQDQADSAESDPIFPVVGSVAQTEHNEKGLCFAKTVPFNKLFEHIRALTKADCEFSIPEIYTDRYGSVHVSFESNDITDQTGPFAAILKNCYLCVFGCGVSPNEKTGELQLWIRIDIRYEHKHGGSNGMDVTSGQYTASTGWEFDR